jgi:outer membrane protein TolC
MKTIVTTLWILALLSPTGAAAAASVAVRFDLAPLDSLPDQPSLDDYLGYALGHNQDLAAAASRQQAAGDHSRAAGSLPNPRLTWSEALAPVETRVGPQQRILALSQQIPWFGSLGLQQEVAGTRAAAAGARTEATALDLLREVRTIYRELAYLRAARAATAGHIDLLVQYEAVARARYETGDASYADVVKAQVEMAQLEDRLAGLDARERPLTARFNAALGREAAAPVHLAEDAVPVPLPDPDVLRGRLLAANPGLAVLDHEADGERLTGDLAGKRRYPDLSLGINWVQVGPARNPGTPDSGKDAAFATLGVTLPLWRGSYDADERAALGRSRAVEHQRADLARRLEAALEQALYDHGDALRRAALYRDTLLPKAHQGLAATRAAYEAGSADFFALVDALRVLLEFELAGRRADADAHISHAAIEQLVAGPVGPAAIPGGE